MQQNLSAGVTNDYPQNNDWGGVLRIHALPNIMEVHIHVAHNSASYSPESTLVFFTNQLWYLQASPFRYSTIPMDAILGVHLLISS